MTTTTFNVIFFLLLGVVLITADYFDKMGLLLKFPYIVVMIAYYIGQYSAKFKETPK